MKNYRTVKNEASAEIIQKKSRFIASVCPCKNEEEAINFINEIKSRHREANHNVYAYICRENNAQRYSDDGEPSGTAGIPVLEVLRKEGLFDVCVVVTRYFGGTLLGAGGLVRAYGKAAKEGIDAAVPVTMVYSDIFSCVCDYQVFGKLKYEIEENGFLILDTKYGENVSLSLCAECGRSGELVSRLTEASYGKAHIEKVGERFVEIKK